MITTKQQLREVLEYEKTANGVSRWHWIHFLSHWHPLSLAYSYICLLHKTEYYYNKFNSSKKESKIEKIIFRFYEWKLQRMGQLCNFDIGLNSVGKGIQIWHNAGGIVINENARIGDDCVFHGNNCIGNDGIESKDAPTIGDRVHFGFGASVLGKVNIASDCWIAAGAVVISNFNMQGSVIAGVPAKLIKVNETVLYEYNE